MFLQVEDVPTPFEVGVLDASYSDADSSMHVSLPCHASSRTEGRLPFRIATAFAGVAGHGTCVRRC
jgi:hypothetical protein